MVEIVIKGGTGYDIEDMKYHCLNGDKFHVSYIKFGSIKDVVAADDFTRSCTGSMYGSVHNSGLTYKYNATCKLEFSIETDLNDKMNFSFLLTLSLEKTQKIGGTPYYYGYEEIIKGRGIFQFKIYSSSGNNKICSDTAELYYWLKKTLEERLEYFDKIDNIEKRITEIGDDFE